MGAMGMVTLTETRTKMKMKRTKKIKAMFTKQTATTRNILVNATTSSILPVAPSSLPK